MSSFMVSRRCMARVISAILDDYWATSAVLAQQRWGNVTEDQRELAARLWAMNRDAMRARYGDEIADGEEIPQYDGYAQLPSGGRARILTQFKAIDCFLYQCAEGDVPEQEMYRKLADLKNRLAYMVVSDLPEYRAAAWG